jgi:hypothetical protein
LRENFTMSLLEVENLKVHFPLKHGPLPRRSGFDHAGGMFNRVRSFVSLTPFRIALNFSA